MKRLTAQTYLEEFKKHPSCIGIKGGTIHDFLKESEIVDTGKDYHILYKYNKHYVVIGGKRKINGLLKLEPDGLLDF